MSAKTRQPVQLPEFEVVDRLAESGKPLTALERFVHNWEVARAADEWRKELLAALEEVQR